jgi:Acetoacetate decarboxylase
MQAKHVAKSAFSMPLSSPAYPRGPYRFINREFLIVTYRTDPALLRELVPEPLQPAGDTVKFEFIRMPDSTGFGDYTESGQVVPVTYKGKPGTYQVAMFLDDEAPLAGGARNLGISEKSWRNRA